MNSNSGNRGKGFSTNEAFGTVKHHYGQFRSQTGWTQAGQIAFVLFIIFMIVFVIMYIKKNYDTTNSNEPWLVQGTKMANRYRKVKGQNIPRSEDSSMGIEFTYSTWAYIDDWGYHEDRYKHILHKGEVTGSRTEQPLLQSPGLWFDKTKNTLILNMNTFEHVRETCTIGNIPLKKWFHLTIVCINKNMDVYINGQLKKRCTLQGLPKQNYEDVHINMDGGFSGFMSQIRYFNYALPIWKIQEIIKQGPSKQPCYDTGELPPYLASDWWMTTGQPTLN